VHTLLDDLACFLCALAALIASAKLFAQTAQVADAFFPDCFSDLAVRNVLADTDVHSEIE
jgi:hypothetical protein